MIRVRETITKDIFDMLICFIQIMVYSANIYGIIEDYFLEADCAIFIHLFNE